MSKRRRRSTVHQEELPLFDFPLDHGDEGSEPSGEPAAAAAPAKRRRPAPADNVHPFPLEPAPAERQPDPGASKARELVEPPATAPAAERRPAASLDRRARAGLIDLGAHVGVMAIALLGVRLQGVEVTLASWPPFLVMILAFSFLYWVVPLAFWGRTPGMAAMGLSARGLEDEPLSFGQTALRWLGALVTLALAGLPLLLTLAGGRALSDQMSGSKTLARYSGR